MTMEERLDPRDWEWWGLWTREGLTQARIAERAGVNQATVSRALQRVRAAIPPETREEELERSLEMLRELRATALAVVHMAPAPVFVGKDGVPALDPESGQYVRDYGGQLQALLAALKVDRQIADRLGLDPAQRMDHTVSGAEEMAARLLGEEAAQRLAGGDPS